MLRNPKDLHVGQALYLGRWVDKKTFRAFVYSDKEQKLANSYDEFENLISSGLWFAEKPKVDASPSKRRQKDDVLRSAG